MADEGSANLAKIEHIVVLMMENRSFDQVLGFLKHAGMPEVEGLNGDELNLDADGNEYPVHEFEAGQTAFHAPGKPLDKSLDPCHSPACVKEQLSGGNGGFVKNFIAKKKPPPEHYGLVMGYYTGEHLPVYDHLAREYCVCDAWHSSVPGDTWPNRLYSLAGRAADSVKPGFLKDLGLGNVPIYDVPTFARQLDLAQWRWYSHDPATLRCADGEYRKLHDQLNRDNFAYFDRKKLNLATKVGESLICAHDSFLDDAAKGELRDVSWIDPNFVDLSVLDPNSCDDHPPSDVRAGQALVLELYEALVKCPQWNETMLVIVYDEHGGFYDHVQPPAIEDDGSGYTTLGVRVPALVIGPRVKTMVCKQVFDHTALIKTILTRFAKDPAKAIAAMGPRVAGSPDLGMLLNAEPRDDIPDPAALRAQMEAWRVDARSSRVAAAGGPSQVADGAGQDLVLHDFQEDFVKFALAMREAGLPGGQP